METNENPPILITSDVKFAVMKDGTVITDKEVDEGPGWMDIAKAFVDRLARASENEFLAILMADTLIVGPMYSKLCQEKKRELEAKIKNRESNE